MSFPRVILIGGAPMSGKTTVAQMLAATLGYGCLSTDDLGAAIRAVTTKDSHPHLQVTFQIKCRSAHQEIRWGREATDLQPVKYQFIDCRRFFKSFAGAANVSELMLNFRIFYRTNFCAP
jgi:cytidylate kinase